MKKMFKLLTVVALSTGATLAMADEKVITENGVVSYSTFKPAAVRAEVGTTGYGGAVSWSVNPKVGLTVGYNGGDISWSDDVSVSGTKYDADMDNNVAYLNAEIRPWGNWLYTALGVGFVDSDYKLTGRPGSNGEVRIDGSTFGADAGRVTGKLEYTSDIAPYIGFGISPSITSRFGVFGEIGAYYTGNPEVTLYNTGNQFAVSANGRPIKDAINTEVKKIENDDKYKFLPVAKVGLTARF